MNPKDFICKMVQVGPTRLMLVMHKSYSHYLVEELRLLPQFDASLDDLNNLNPDAVSFLGIPTKVMGPEYRVGYFLDQCSDAEQKVIPVSWVDAEDITNYMGYLKKPLLTMGNERIKAIGGLRSMVRLLRSRLKMVLGKQLSWREIVAQVNRKPLLLWWSK